MLNKTHIEGKIIKNTRELFAPCPFCGTGNSMIDCVENEYGFYQVWCGRCGCSGGIRPDKNREKTIEHWNTRNK